MTVRYVTLDELIYINEQFNLAVDPSLKGVRAVRDMNLLEAAVARPMQSAFGQDAYPTTTEKAAALLHSLVRNHPFADGNKRTATIALLFMLQVNGLQTTWEPSEALEHIVAVAEGHLSLPNFADWLPVDDGLDHLEEDAERDIALIAAIKDDHNWLLTELAGR